MLSISSERIPGNLLILDAKNHDKWCKQMNVLFDYQDALKVIKNGVIPFVEGATVAQRTSYKEEKTVDHKALYHINQCVYADNFEKVGDCTSSKEA